MDQLNKKEIKIFGGLFLLVVFLALLVNLIYDKKRPNKIQTEKLNASLLEIEELKKEISRREAIIKNQEDSLKRYAGNSVVDQATIPESSVSEEQENTIPPSPESAVEDQKPEVPPEITPEEKPVDEECENKIEEKEKAVTEQEKELEEAKEKLTKYKEEEYLNDCKEEGQSETECKEKQEDKIKEQEAVIKKEEESLEDLKEELEEKKKECAKES